METGKKLIQLFCTPKNGKRTYWYEAIDEWNTFKEYNKRDVETEMEIHERLMKFPVPEYEWDNYHLDQRINDYGVMLRNCGWTFVAEEEDEDGDMVYYYKQGNLSCQYSKYKSENFTLNNENIYKKKKGKFSLKIFKLLLNSPLVNISGRLQGTVKLNASNNKTELFKFVQALKDLSKKDWSFESNLKKGTRTEYFKMD